MFAFKHPCWHQNPINVGRKSHLGSIVPNLCRDLKSGGINSSDLHLLHSCSALVWEAFSRWASSSISASARLPVWFILAPCVPRESLLLLDRWLDDLQSPADLPDDFCLQQPLPCLFLVPDYCLAFVPALGLLYPPRNQICSITEELLALWCFIHFCLIVEIVVFISESEHSHALFLSRIIPMCWPSSFPLDAHFHSAMLQFASTSGLA